LPPCLCPEKSGSRRLFGASAERRVRVERTGSLYLSLRPDGLSVSCAPRVSQFERGDSSKLSCEERYRQGMTLIEVGTQPGCATGEKLVMLADGSSGLGHRRFLRSVARHQVIRCSRSSGHDLAGGGRLELRRLFLPRFWQVSTRLRQLSGPSSRYSVDQRQSSVGDSCCIDSSSSNAEWLVA